MIYLRYAGKETMFVKKTKAAILVKSHEPLVISEIDLPDELNFGQVLVKLHYSGICASQIHEIDAFKGPDKFLPHLLGHEGSATVLAVGPGVKMVRPNDRVVMHWRKGAGIESEPPAYRWDGKIVNAGWVTTFNEYAVVSENRLTVIPVDINVRVAPLFGCAVTTAFGVINNDAKLKIGNSIIVFGVGGLGLAVVLGASMVSAFPIIAVDIVDHKLDMAKSFGATHVFNSNQTNLNAEVKSILGGHGSDVVVETTGMARVIEQAYDITKPQGRTILVGVPKIGDNAAIYTLPLHFKKILKGSHGGDSKPEEDIPNYIRLMQNGRLSLDRMITHEFTLDEANDAIELVRTGLAGRVILEL